MSRNILLAVVGTKSWVVSQALYCFRVEQNIPITEIIIITTKVGEDVLRKGNVEVGPANLLGKGGILQRFCHEYGIAPIEPKIVLMKDQKGVELKDTRTIDECQSGAFSILDTIRNCGLSDDDNVYCIFAGGRRLMVSYLMSALTIAGRANDRLYYVLITPEEASHVRDFYYKPKDPATIALPGGIKSTADVSMQMIEIPFPRLGEKYASVIRGDKSYRAVVLHIQDFISSEPKPAVSSDSSARKHQEIIGEDPKWKEALKEIDRFAKAKISPILIHGETGTGKELCAQYYHSCLSNYLQKEMPFVAIDMNGIPQEMSESELFGHEKGGFTGATHTRVGLLKSANGGVAFLDELGKASASLQTKLLRVLEYKEMRPVGSDRLMKIDVAFVFAMKEDIDQLLDDNLMTEDFFYRVSMARVLVPPLRERLSDIPLLARHFIERSCRTQNKETIILSDQLLDLLLHHTWPGNTRVLKQRLEWLVTQSNGKKVSDELLVKLKTRLEEDRVRMMRRERMRINGGTNDALLSTPGANDGGSTFKERQSAIERDVLERKYHECGENAARTARALGMKPSTLKDKLKGHGIIHQR